MAKTPANSGKPWTSQDVRQLQQLARQNTPTRVIALKLERTPGAVQSEAARESISLKPTNQSPYNRQKK
jgi:IS30 family transposase